jgi:cell volume regulation protein A
MELLPPGSLPLFLVVIAVLMISGAMLSSPSQRAGVPAGLGFLALGLIGGHLGLRQLLFHNYNLCFNLGTVGLVLILFDGGLNTPTALLSRGLFPASLLATIGVIASAALCAACGWLLNFSWKQAFLLGAIVAPTDAAAVFPLLRSSGLQLRRRIATTLELEAGLNDPVAAALTISLSQALALVRPFSITAILAVPLTLVLGLLVGILVGYGGRQLLKHARLFAGGLYPIMTIALALLAFGLAALLHGSGFLAVYTASLVLGNGRLPYHAGILRVHDATAWLSQISLYLMLGSLPNPSELLVVAPTGIAIAFFLALVARPISVALCLVPLRYSMREVFFIGLVGLRGAIPIVLATYPVLIGVPGALGMFNIVFFIVLVSIIVQGATVRWLTTFLQLQTNEQPAPPAVLELVSTRVLTGAEIASFTIDQSAAACGAQISDLPLPQGSSLILLIRDSELIAPRGTTMLHKGDHVYVLCRPEDRPLIHLIFGHSEED